MAQADPLAPPGETPDPPGEIKRFGQSVGLRFNLWYAAYFIVASCLIFAALYYFIASMLEERNEQERKIVAQRMNEIIAWEQRGGLPQLQHGLTIMAEAVADAFFVRVAQPNGSIFFTRTPRDEPVMPAKIDTSDGRGRSFLFGGSGVFRGARGR